jgi:hypothetical protein
MKEIITTPKAPAAKVHTRRRLSVMVLFMFQANYLSILKTIYSEDIAEQLGNP